MSQSANAIAALLLRLASGGLVLSHGLLKLLVFTPAGAAQYFGSIGLPPALAYVVIAAELLGGALLLAGLFYRATAITLLPVMIGATYVHLHNGWLFSSPDGGWEFPAFWTLTLIVQALLGPGAFAVDALLPRLRPQALNAA